MNIALIQTSATSDKEANVRKVKQLVREASEQAADIICLPEGFLYHGDEQEKKVEEISSSLFVAFQDIARTQSVNIVLGSAIVQEKQEGKPVNVSLIIDRSGEIVHRYRKQYLYDVERSNFSYHESHKVEPGHDLGVFELDGVTIGVGICVDVRYPEYFRELAGKGAEIVFLPSNFRKATGHLAWDILTRARAIENQLYFCACGQTGGTGAMARVGNSRIVSYDGSIMSEAGEEEGITSATVDLQALRAFRKEFPVLKQVKKY